MKDATGKLARWRLRLPEFDFEVFHWAYLKHQAAHALFRRPTTRMDKSPLEDNIHVLTITNAQLEREKSKQTQNFGIFPLVMRVWTLQYLPFQSFYKCQTKAIKKVGLRQTNS